ncbi:hypothetical protein AAG570_003867 [Ranatra chinensis]|uniref:Uncharacterized protein n=1 Tax=Ranatra chinensis TaxID=642074 RepID=A0ABD0Y2W5_9HEMI
MIHTRDVSNPLPLLRILHAIQFLCLVRKFKITWLRRASSAAALRFRLLSHSPNTIAANGVSPEPVLINELAARDVVPGKLFHSPNPADPPIHCKADQAAQSDPSVPTHSHPHNERSVLPYPSLEPATLAEEAVASGLTQEMEVTPVDQQSGELLREESSSKQSSCSQVEKNVGSALVSEKTSSFESEQSSHVVSQSTSEVISGQVAEQSIELAEEEPLHPTEEGQEMEESHQNGEIKQEEIRTTLKGIISEIEEQLPMQNEIVEPKDTSQQQELHEVSTQRKPLRADRQTSTTSLEEHQRETTARDLLEALMTRASEGAAGKDGRPHSLPPNLSHLWQSLKYVSVLGRHH